MIKMPTTKRKEREKLKEEEQAAVERGSVTTRNKVLAMVAAEVKKAHLVVVEEPSPENVDAVTTMTMVVSKVASTELDRFVLVLAHSPAAAVRAFKLLYERTTLRMYIEADTDDGDKGNDDSSDGSVYFNSLYSWVKHRVVVATPGALRKKLEKQGQGLITQVSLVVLCDTFRMRLQSAGHSESKENVDTSISVKSFTDTIGLLDDKKAAQPLFLSPEDGRTKETTAELLWSASEKEELYSIEPNSEIVITQIVQRKVQQALLKCPTPQEESITVKQVGVSCENGGREETVKPDTQASSGPTGGSRIAEELIVTENPFGDEKELPQEPNPVEIIEELPRAQEQLQSQIQPPAEPQITQSQQISQVSHGQLFNNSKSDLQSYCQRYFGGKLPVYEGNKVTLPDGRVFEVDPFGSKKETEKRAALIALNAIRSQTSNSQPQIAEAQTQTPQVQQTQMSQLQQVQLNQQLPVEPQITQSQQTSQVSQVQSPNNSKSDLQSYCQRYFGGKLPVYEGNKVMLPDGRVFEADFYGNKKEMEKRAALIALNAIRSQTSNSQPQIAEAQPQTPQGQQTQMSQSQQLPEEPQLQQEQPQAQTPQIQIIQSQQTSQVSQVQSSNNSKSDLQSYCQRYFGGKLPVYEGNKVMLPDGRVFEADFYGNKKEMEKRAALIALNAIRSQTSNSQPQIIEAQPQTQMSQSQELPEEPQLQQEQPQAQTPQIQIMQSQQTSQVSQAQSFNNPKSDLQSYCQRYFGGKLPMYEGNKVTLPDGRVFEADFYGNKKEMEKRAALIALNAISKK